MGYIFTLIPQRSPLIIRPIAHAICKNVLNMLVKPQVKTNAEMIESSTSPSPPQAGSPLSTRVPYSRAGWRAVKDSPLLLLPCG
ncbi:hypothetical protein CALVIDRAFT_392670 [Calocera viscosa TUFC12733]|uniref:Uncharacterized protein n=1 Tax=Calocera viscosa (strain TUFC12733) TaxID=1330018 RepID=A0A167GE92_CALVF|nr:hypothetical protein CALVIDRAFT_392670 [Calocera viscosa TUFC12733]